METFLASNPGLNSRFGLRVKFPGYSPAELMALAELVAWSSAARFSTPTRARRCGG